MKAPLAVAALLLLGACATAPLRTTQLPQGTRERPQDYLIVAVRNDAARMSAQAGATVRGYDGVTRYGPSPQSKRLIAALAQEYGLAAVAGWPIDPLRLECVVFRIGLGQSSGDLLARLSSDPRVRLAEPMHAFTTLGAYNDPYVGLQKNVVALDLDGAHRWASGAGVRIAIIDTGVSVDHPDLAGGIVERHDFVGGGDAVFRHDVHGTEIAGVIAARANNHIGIVGVAPQSELIAIKACWQPGSYPHAVCNTFTLAQAISRAVESRARIVNLSLTGPSDPLLAQLVTWGMGRGVIFVGAVAADGRLAAFPADIPGVLAVDRAESASRSAGVIYTVGDGILTLTPDSHYDFASGSSMAAAQVSGLLALMLEHRTLSAQSAQAILAASVHTRSSPGAEAIATLDACEAVAAVLNVSCSALASVLRR